MKPALEKYMEELAKTKKSVKVVVRGDRTVEGKIQAIDKHMNVLLRESIETKVQKGCNTKGVKRRNEKIFVRSLGNVFIRGETVISLHID
ncbi:hypothetical protein NEMIN01_0425 [Nematocida minor]|uniref:uncharacterized protein n=1 Tax=Nematocida minor TaxID=1912983 RepID=UPI00221F7075|nr:uncharacterized protein NEMIN01_0425 [Nematocida minor]KAI5189362.1 hypothetical protein NEMIN01_0425 [Nematocida minor]